MGFLANLFSPQNNFQYQNAPVQQTGVGSTLQGALGQPNNTLQQQQSLAQALQQQMAGGGPNLAQTQLQSATDRANTQAAGLLGSARGMDPGLAARQILQQQAGNTQAAANQSAQLQQQQQLAAQQQLGNVLNQQGQLGLGQVGTLGQLQNQQNATNVQQALGGQQLNLQGQLASQNAGQTLLGGLLGGVGSLLAAPATAGAAYDGAYVEQMKEGGFVPGEAKREGDHPDNDTVHAMLSPGEVVIPRSLVRDADPKEIKKFIDALKSEHEEGPSKGYGKVLKAKEKMKKYQGGEC